MEDAKKSQSSKSKVEPAKVLDTLDDDLNKARELVLAVHQLQKQQEDADLKASKEIRAHAETKQKMKAIEAEEAQYRESIENERKLFALSKFNLEKEERAHAKTQDALKEAKNDVGTMLLQMEAMKVEMTAQRKAFVVNTNWASRCQELKIKLEQSQQEYDQLGEQHAKMKSDMEAALRGQEEFKKQYQAALVACDAARAELQEINSRPGIPPDYEAKMAELEAFRQQRESDIIKKKQGNSKALAVLQRAHAQADTGLKTSAFQGWSSLTAVEKKKRAHKDKLMQQTARRIANDGSSLIHSAFNAWCAQIRDEKGAEETARKHAEERRLQDERDRRIREMETELFQKDAELMTFRQQRDAEIIKKKQGSQKALAVLQRNQAKGDLGAITSAFQGWSTLVVAEKKKRSHKDNVMNSTLKRIASEGTALMANVFKEWSLVIENIRRAATLVEERRLREERESSLEAQKAQLEVSRAELAEFEAQRDAEKMKKNQGRQKALLVLSRNQAKGDLGVKTATFQGWSTLVAAERKKRTHKNNVMKQTMRKIGNEGTALMGCVFKEWLLEIKTSKLAVANAAMDDARDRRMQAMAAELEQSRRKAKDIGEELAKIGIFLEKTPRKTSASGRPRSGVVAKNGDAGGSMLPQIDNGPRPSSGIKKDGSRSARGERSGSAQRRRVKKDIEERRFLDEAGPYTYAEFLDVLAPQGMDYALAKWQTALLAEAAPISSSYA